MICYSGGADGADLRWCEAAARTPNWTVEIFTFAKQGLKRPVSAHPENIVVHELNEQQLKEADPVVRAAGRRMGKSMPRTARVFNLLARSWYIVKQADALFAIGKRNPAIPGLGVDGGTGWTCEMFFNKKRLAASFDNTMDINMFLFDMVTEKWFSCDRNGRWKEIARPELRFQRNAMVGSRELTPLGLKEIKGVYSVEFVQDSKVKADIKDSKRTRLDESEPVQSIHPAGQSEDTLH